MIRHVNPENGEEIGNHLKEEEYDEEEDEYYNQEVLPKQKNCDDSDNLVGKHSNVHEDEDFLKC